MTKKNDSQWCFLAYFTSFLLLLSACKGDNTIGFPDKDPLTIEVMDTVNILASTVILDSLPTSNMGVIMLGSIDDKDFGKVKASSYMQFSPKTTGISNIPANAKFDSLTLVLKYNGYYLGDTIVAKEIRVHRLTQNIKLWKMKQDAELEERPVFGEEEALYSTSKFDYQVAALGTKLFKPRPKSNDSLSITLDQQLGKEFFNLVVEKDNKGIQRTEFLEYFKGLFLTTANGNSITGFNADPRLEVHYHYEHYDGTVKTGRIIYDMDSKNMQFNHIDADRSATNIKELNYRRKEVDLLTTKGQLFVQGGTGIVTKLLMPGLSTFLKEPKIAINKVELVIETASDTYSTFKAPEGLILFIANTSNTPKVIVHELFAKEPQRARFQPGNDAGSNGRYVFQLTDYVSELKKGQHHNTSLMISLPVVELTSTLNRLHILNKKSGMPIRLRVIYTKI